MDSLTVWDHRAAISGVMGSLGCLTVHPHGVASLGSQCGVWERGV